MRLTTWLFLRGLAAIHVIALTSFAVQFRGLIGVDGVSPLVEFVEYLEGRGFGFFDMPMVFWLDGSDAFIQFVIAVGYLAGFALLVGMFERPALVTLWVVYLSLIGAGQVFMNFQWDTLLLETTVVAMFLATQSVPHLPGSRLEPGRWGPLLARALLFKLMFLSGIVKLLCLDETWWNLSALEYHYWTQPLPNGLSYFADGLPPLIQKLSVGITYVIEILIPFFVFGPRRLRNIAGVVLIAFQVLILASGNYGFFNHLTVILCLMCLDDEFITRWLPERLRSKRRAKERTTPRWRTITGAVLACALLGLSFLTALRECVRTYPYSGDHPDATLTARALDFADEAVLSWAQPALLEPIYGLRSVNGYGLFRSMTTDRPELQIEGSYDGQTWRPYVFKYKPGPLDRRPPFVTPHMPRLDWQMWFAALSPQHYRPWLGGLVLRLLEGSPDVLDLLENDPFPEAPPRYVRVLLYQYEFTNAAEREATGHWWKRSFHDRVIHPVTLSHFHR